MIKLITKAAISLSCVLLIGCGSFRGPDRMMHFTGKSTLENITYFEGTVTAPCKDQYARSEDELSLTSGNVSVGCVLPVLVDGESVSRKIFCSGGEFYAKCKNIAPHRTRVSFAGIPSQDVGGFWFPKTIKEKEL